MQTIQPEGMWFDRWVNRNMWSVTNTPPIPIGHIPTAKRHLQHRGLGPVTLSNRQRGYGQHQLNIKRSHRSGFWANLSSSGWHTDKYLTNDDHVRHLSIRRSSWLLWWASPRIMSHTVKPHNPHRTTIHLPLSQLFLLMQTIQPEGTWCDQRENRNMRSVTSTPLIPIRQQSTPVINDHKQQVWRRRWFTSGIWRCRLFQKSRMRQCDNFWPSYKNDQHDVVRVTGYSLQNVENPV